MLQLYIAENVTVERLLYHCVLQLYLIRTVTVVSNPFCIEHSYFYMFFNLHTVFTISMYYGCQLV